MDTTYNWKVYNLGYDNIVPKDMCCVLIEHSVDVRGMKATDVPSVLGERADLNCDRTNVEKHLYNQGQSAIIISHLP